MPKHVVPQLRQLDMARAAWNQRRPFVRQDEAKGTPAPTDKPHGAISQEDCYPVDNDPDRE